MEFVNMKSLKKMTEWKSVFEDIISEEKDEQPSHCCVKKDHSGIKSRYGWTSLLGIREISEEHNKAFRYFCSKVEAIFSDCDWKKLSEEERLKILECTESLITLIFDEYHTLAELGTAISKNASLESICVNARPLHHLLSLEKCLNLQNITSINLHFSGFSFDEEDVENFFVLLSNSCKMINSLQLENEIDYTPLNQVSLKAIQKLPLTIIWFSQMEFTHEDFPSFFASFPQMKQIHINECDGDCGFISAVSQKCKNLEKFHLVREDDEFTRKEMKCLSKILRSNPNMKEFLVHSDYGPASVNVTTIKSMKECNNLEVIGFKCLHPIGCIKDDFLGLFTKFKNLRTLAVELQGFSQAWLDHIASNCTKLETFAVSTVYPMKTQNDEIDLVQFAKNNKNLKELTLNVDGKLSDKSFSALKKYCKQLEKLDCTCYDFEDSDSSMDDELSELCLQM